MSNAGISGQITYYNGGTDEETKFKCSCSPNICEIRTLSVSWTR